MSSADDSSSNQHPHKYTDWGFERLEEVSRTFALSIEYLPSPTQTYVSTSYLLCRIPDTIEDEFALSATDKSRLLSAYRLVIQDEKEVGKFVSEIETVVEEVEIEIDADWNLVLESEKVLELFRSFPVEIQQAMIPWVDELTNGMRIFIERYAENGGVRIQSIEELEEYCYYVAGTVGHLLADVFSVEYDVPINEEKHQYAEDYGLVLQLINIAKDVYDDFEEENNVYLPIDRLSAVEVPVSQLTVPEHKDSVGDVVYEIVERAESYESSAQNFLSWLRDMEAEVYESFALPYLLAVATMRELKANTNKATEPGEVKIERAEVFAITNAVTSEDSPPIPELTETIRQGNLQN